MADEETSNLFYDNLTQLEEEDELEELEELDEFEEI